MFYQYDSTLPIKVPPGTRYRIMSTHPALNGQHIFECDDELKDFPRMDDDAARKHLGDTEGCISPWIVEKSEKDLDYEAIKASCAQIIDAVCGKYEIASKLKTDVIAAIDAAKPVAVSVLSEPLEG